jgi:nucleoside-diphosphate-sugar epimerase
MILVTGPDGFVGTRVCRVLLERGFEVSGAQWRTAPLPEGCRSVVVGDIGPDTDWQAALPGADVVVHLAARVHVMRDSAANPLAAFRTVNADGTRRLAQCAARAGVKRFVFLSTVKVHGEETGGAVPADAVERTAASSKLVFTEADAPAPEDPYAVSKWEAEQALRIIEADTGLGVTILRPPLIYGPGVKANFRKLAELVARGVPLPLGCVKNARSLIGLSNVADAIAACVEQDKAAGKTYLVSDGDDVSTPELVRRLATALGKKPRLLPVREKCLRWAGKVTGKTAAIERLLGSLLVDSGKIRAELGWRPVCSMRQELAQLAEEMA